MIELPDNLLIRQKSKIDEMIGIQSANCYQILSQDQQLLISVEEVPRPYWEGNGFTRQTTSRGWTKHPLTYRDQSHSTILRATHPISWFLDRVLLHTTDGTSIGTIQARFHPLRHSFDIKNESGKTVMHVSNGVFDRWTYSFRKDGAVVGLLKKDWKGFMKEALTSEDSFKMDIVKAGLDPVEKLLMLASSIYVDLKYFNRPPIKVKMGFP